MNKRNQSAGRVGVPSPTALAKYIDHTFLKAAGDAKAVLQLCREAKKYGFASVCVNPAEVALAAKLLKKSATKVCTVIGFPLGQNTTAVKILEAEDAIYNGARELDFVINQRLLKSAAAGDQKALKDIQDELGLCAKVKTAGTVTKLGNPEIVTKLIIECCNLTKDEKILACKLAKKAGFDFVKTSTGFGTGGATVEDVKLMRKTVGKKMGVKAAGGIRTREDAEAMIAAGANRLGCSCGVKIVSER